MARIVIVVGLPGSGKSHWIDERRVEFTGLVSSDYFENPLVPSPRFTDSRHYRQLIEALHAGRDCLVADIVFCDTLRRVEAAHVLAMDAPTAEIQWVYFENNPNACSANIVRDGGARVVARLKYLSLSYKYFVPPGVETLPVWKPSGT